MSLSEHCLFIIACFFLFVNTFFQKKQNLFLLFVWHHYALWAIIIKVFICRLLACARQILFPPGASANAQPITCFARVFGCAIQSQACASLTANPLKKERKLHESYNPLFSWPPLLTRAVLSVFYLYILKTVWFNLYLPNGTCFSFPLVQHWLSCVCLHFITVFTKGNHCADLSLSHLVFLSH